MGEGWSHAVWTAAQNMLTLCRLGEATEKRKLISEVGRRNGPICNPKTFSLMFYVIFVSALTRDYVVCAQWFDHLSSPLNEQSVRYHQRPSSKYRKVFSFTRLLSLIKDGNIQIRVRCPAISTMVDDEGIDIIS